MVQVPKTLLVDHSDCLEIVSRVQMLRLSRKTISRRLDTIAISINPKIKKLIKSSQAISLCVDESTDINDMAQHAIRIRIV